jgi:hypothetical protein
MIIRPPSYQREYTDHWPGDPAFVQPPSDESELKEYERKLRVARETGDWKPLLVEGAQPTAFIMGQVDRSIWRALGGRMMLPSSNPRWIGSAEGVALLFRLALVKIVGLDVEVDRRPDPRWEGWVMASPEVVNVLDAIDMGIVGELGDQVYLRLRGLSGK